MHAIVLWNESVHDAHCVRARRGTAWAPRRHHTRMQGSRADVGVNGMSDWTMNNGQWTMSLTRNRLRHVTPRYLTHGVSSSLFSRRRLSLFRLYSADIACESFSAALTIRSCPRINLLRRHARWTVGSCRGTSKEALSYRDRLRQVDHRYTNNKAGTLVSDLRWWHTLAVWRASHGEACSGRA